MLDNYCWVKGTYTNKPDLNNPEQGQRGRIDHFCHPEFDENGKFLNNCWHHYYYQWVALVILCQAGCFYLPRALWQNWECGKVKSLVDGLDKSSLIRGLQDDEDLTKGNTNEKLNALVDIWKRTCGTHNVWAVKFYACELMNIINISAQFIFTNFFLGNQFGVVAYEGFGNEEHVSVLPITAVCHPWEYFGGGGGKATKWSLCVLPLNMINQKFYSFFYFWLFFLMITSLTTLVIRIGLIGSPSLREISTKFHFDGIKFKAKHLKNCTHGDWLLLTRLTDNMNPIIKVSFFNLLEKDTQDKANHNNE